MNRGPVVIFLVLIMFFPARAQLVQTAWQQRVNYNINVKLDDAGHFLNGFETVEYINNSPDILNEIFFHLWPNAYSGQNTAFARQMLETGNTKFWFAPDSSLGYIDSLDFMVNGQSVKMIPDPQHPDICKLVLNAPLASGQRITISTPFRVKLPAVFSRMGHEGQSYQVSQWYPKPAVYDVNGWNPMPYLDQGEFYSEFGSFDVSITVPANYVVASTGILQDAVETEWLLQRSKEPTSAGRKSEPPPSAATYKTLRYLQDSIHDFAWFADKRFNVFHSQVVLPGSGRTVASWVYCFSNTGQQFCSYINQAVAFYSGKVGEYPYAHATVVEGALKAGGGMEYPMITVIDIMDENVIVHEVGHNWFYGILGSNERQHAWMDEGINSFYEQWCVDSFSREVKIGVPDKRLIRNAIGDLSERSAMDEGYRITVMNGNDQPVALKSDEFTKFNYGVIVYGKASKAFNYLKEYLGEELFTAAMRSYYDTWKFRHPLPGDLRKTFETVSGKDLGWFFNDLLNTTGIIDYKVRSAKKRTGPQGDHFYTVTIENKGDINAPLFLGSMKNDSVLYLKKLEGFQGKQDITITQGDFDMFRIDPFKVMPEVKRKNNSARTYGLFRKVEKLSILPIGGLDMRYRTQISVLPLYAWNRYNRSMAGVAFHNITLVRRTTEYIFAPLFSFETKDINGFARLSYNRLFSNSILKKAELGMNTTRFSFRNLGEVKKYMKFTPYLLLEGREPIRSTVRKTVRLAYYNINENMNNGFGSSFLRTDSSRQFITAELSLVNSRAIDPFHVKLNFEQSILRFGSNFTKVGIEGKYKLGYGRAKKHLQIRVYGGKMFFSGASPDGLYHLRLSGHGGRKDYLYEHALLGRSEEFGGLLSQQVLQREGGFKAEADVSSSDNWILALNLRSSIPTKIPLKLYADLGTFAGATELVYQAGIMFNISEVLEIYFPVFSSPSIKAFYDTFPDASYFHKVTFRLDLNRLDPMRLIRNIPF